MVTRARIFDLITAVGLPQLQRGLWLPFITVPKKRKERRGKQHTNLMGGVRTISVSSLSLSLFLMVEEEKMTIVSDTGSIRST